MSKLGWYGLLTFVLFGCGASKLKPNELFLSPDSSSEKIYILSAFPKETDSSGLYLSALLVKHSNEDNRQLIAFVTTFDRSTQQAATVPYFIDSLLQLDGTSFPLLFKSSSNNASETAFSCSLERRSIEVTGKTTDGEINQRIEFPKQKPFKAKAAGTEFQLTLLEPISATLKQWNSETSNQASRVKLHTIDNGAALFESGSTKKYCWLDCSISDSVDCSLFFQYDSLGKITPIYSTLPENVLRSLQLDPGFNSVEQARIDSFTVFTMNYPTEQGPQILSVRLLAQQQNRVLTKNTFSVRAVDILIDNRLMGTGILYIL